jgi:glycosyltransferase involved in cell wall biosynthesis
VAFVNTHPIQYFAPLYAHLNAAPDIDVTAIYLSDFSIRGAPDREFRTSIKWDVDLLQGYDARFVDGYERRREPDGFFSVLAPGVWRQITEGRFDLVVVHGHTPAAMIVAIAAARAAGTPVFMHGDAHLGLRRSALKATLRRSVMGLFYKSLDGFMAIGRLNRELYLATGVREDRIFEMPYAVDNARFSGGATLTASERRAVRASLGVHDERPIVLYAAKFQRRKRPGDLIEAIARLQSEGAPVALALVGSGELERELRELSASLGMEGVAFPGFVNQQALPAIYASSDLFVLPSMDEPWGLAVNEAMCAGLPVVISDEVGCGPDLVVNGSTGTVFPAGNVAELADALRPLLLDEALRLRMGRAARRHIDTWSFDQCLAGLRAALAATGARETGARP